MKIEKYGGEEHYLLSNGKGKPNYAVTLYWNKALRFVSMDACVCYPPDYTHFEPVSEAKKAELWKLFKNNKSVRPILTALRKM